MNFEGSQIQVGEAVVIMPTKIYDGKRIFSKEATCLILEKSERSLRRYVELGWIKPEYTGPGKMDVEFTKEAIDDFRARKWAERKTKRGK